MTNDNYSKLTEKYLEGEMSGTEAAEFEKLLSQDPMLASEYGLQQEVINGVKDYRKQELKTRLDNIDVTPGFFQSVATNTAFQAASAVIVTGLIVLGVYLSQSSEDFDKPFVDLTGIKSKSFILESQGTNPSGIDQLPIITFEPKSPLTTEVRAEENTETERPVVAKAPKAEKEVSIIPQVVSPDLADDADTDLPSSVSAISIDAIGDISNRDQVEVEHVTTSKQNFQYKFSNNKLYLFGDFGGIPYEILEIHGKSGKKLYLYHNDIFYKIENSSSKSKLKESH